MGKTKIAGASVFWRMKMVINWKKLKYKNAKIYSAIWWSWRFAANIMAYVPPVPKNGLSVEQRDLLAIKLGRETAKKTRQGIVTCVWHELALYYNSSCNCVKCRGNLAGE